jgi:hypothetical protein
MQSADKLDAETRSPVILTGIVTRIEGFDFCMDGAAHFLNGLHFKERLVSSDSALKRKLEEVAGTRQPVIVSGFHVLGPECIHLEVRYIGPASDAAKILGVI